MPNMSVKTESRVASRGRLRTVVPAALAVVLAVSAVVVWTAWSRRVRAKSAERVAAVDAALRARDFGAARAVVDAWNAERPRDAEAAYQRARVEVAADIPQAALDGIDEAVRRGYDPARCVVLRAVILARGGKLDEAEPVLSREFREAAVLDPEVAEGLTRIYLSTFRLPAAGAVLDRWVKDAPDDARPYLYRIEVDQRTDVEPAVQISHYRMALKRDPGLDKARLGLADKLRDAQRTEEALAEYEAYLKRKPKSVEAHVGAGEAALRKGDLAAAVSHFDAALALNPREPVALRELALIDMRANRFARARDRLKTVVEVDAYDPEVRLSYARALKMSGDEAGAKGQMDVLERLRKDHAEMADLRKKLVLDGKNLDLRIDAARWLLDHGHEAEGLEWTALVLREHPNHPRTCALLADYYRRTGNVGLANFYKLSAEQDANSKK